MIQLTYEALVGSAQATFTPSTAKKGKVLSPGEHTLTITFTVQIIGLNPDDRDLRFAVSEDGLMGQSRGEQTWCGARGTVGVVKGRHYYEALCTDEGLCRVGWSTKAASYDLG